MGLETTYEIRTIIKGKVANRVFVNSPQELYAEFKSLDPSRKTYIFKIFKDGDGKIVASNKISCKIHKNSFILKTIYEKSKRIPKDSERPKFVPRDVDRRKEVYDIALFQPLPTLKRVLPNAPRLSPTSSGRLAKFPKKTEAAPPSRSTGSNSMNPGSRPTSRIYSKTTRGSQTSRLNKSRRRT